MSNLFRVLYRWILPIIDVKKVLFAPSAYIKYFQDWQHYSRLEKTGINMSDAFPVLYDRTSTTDFDHHYIYLNAWAFREIVAKNPKEHIDVGSQVGFVTLLSAIVPVTFIDIRPLNANLSGLKSIAGSIVDLPYEDGALLSVSSLHVLEHIGLGRYGDPIDPLGTRRAISELARVMAPGGVLYVGLPVGRERVCFNAHRVSDPFKIAEWFENEGMKLENFSFVDDNGDYQADVDIGKLDDLEYGCGMFKFNR